ncbi:MAG: hypothetical protein WBJ68_19130 [Candidatus Dechloromonas phosphoritropha]|jgi:hypothetical protein|nr:hypothetical protein [Candidatus Dechloromonas phosphoritropha]
MLDALAVPGQGIFIPLPAAPAVASRLLTAEAFQRLAHEIHGRLDYDSA